MEVEQVVTRLLHDPEFLESLLLPIPEGEREDVLGWFGKTLLDRFETTASMDDLGCAIMMLEMCLELIGDENGNRETILSNLGSERTGSMEDLNRAIEKKEQAVESTPVDHPDRAGLLSNLGGALRSRLERTGSMEDLGHVIEKKKQAVESTPVDHPNCAIILNNLGAALQKQFERIKLINNLIGVHLLSFHH